MFNNNKIDDEKIEKILDKIGLFYKVRHDAKYTGYLFRNNNTPYELWLNEYGHVFFGVVQRQFDKPVNKWIIFKTDDCEKLKKLLEILFIDFDKNNLIF